MCYAVFIGTNEKQQLGQFVPMKTDMYFEELTDQEENGLRPKFTKPYIYYIGSDTSCSCGLNFLSDHFDDPEWQNNKKSPQKFLDFIHSRTKYEDLEYYCCWEGNWNDPIEEKIELDISTISLDKNYFGLNEKQFIKFSRRK